MLSNFQVGDRALLQSFLVGQPELRRIMQHHTMQQLRQRVIASYHLGPLDRDETERYIEHRLKHVGWRGDPKVESEAYDAVFAFTSGIPRRINLVFNRLMLSAFLRDAQELKEELGAVMQSEQASVQAAEAGGSRIDEPGVHIGSSDGVGAIENVLDEVGDSSLEGRIARIERTLSALLQMLRKMAHVIEPVARQGSQIRH